ncbi:phage terminase small subunit P27 family [Clostridium botulinum]|uniref:phage terminase small subunit P27 family n=1 Tax=Clostridium botulinum TaxID=1491 RepID=UPI0007736A25|nr:phage terminase small subunit P27 family [Clostridium botulinum]NFE93704.1 phage terminase small subunit P27 family [Clostridium botulinum]NFL38454.1 phage terminase small subunit P27 family [Clostridium botulinum]NFL65894.1 phage terminase small subunit P27 family [Clostridium botulinum]NFN08291.1 phage terminase small subunit P27 family [Clostridium botulinum]NFN18472.1 phage terminase small subunit P27 family [Clostridium botulinum]
MAKQREPINLIEAKGRKHLSKAEIAERRANEVKAPNDKIRAPSYLPKDLKKEFKKISKELISIDIMSNLDCDCLARFLISQKQYIKITTELDKINPIETIKSEEKDKEGNVIGTKFKEVINTQYDSLMLMQDRAFKQCRQASSDLGLSISSRCRLVVPKPQQSKKENKFSKFAK